MLYYIMQLKSTGLLVISLLMGCSGGIWIYTSLARIKAQDDMLLQRIEEIVQYDYGRHYGKTNLLDAVQQLVLSSLVICANALN